MTECLTQGYTSHARPLLLYWKDVSYFIPLKKDVYLDTVSPSASSCVASDILTIPSSCPYFFFNFFIINFKT